jgi:DNA repair protein RecO (recombination protein O)
MILKDKAIALRIHPFGNTSRIVVWLSETHGKLATLVKGSQREKSPFLGQYDLFYTCELLFYAREQRNLHILKECYPLELRTAFRADWRACAVASYAAGALDRAMPIGPAPAGLYTLLAETLDRLAARTPGPAFLPRFELLLLQELGLAPGWNACAKCRTDLRGGAPARLDVAHGAVVCAACAAGQGKEITAAALQAIRQMRDGNLPPSLPERVFREVRAVAGGLLEYHADLAPESRNIAFQILSAG